MTFLTVALTALFLAAPASQGTDVSFPTEDGGLVHGTLYGAGERGVVLAHGGQFNKESWEAQADVLAKAGYRALAFDFRGHGNSRGAPGAGAVADGRYFDVLAAITYLRTNGATSIAVVGASMGGDYAAEACESAPGRIDRLVLIAAGAYTTLKRCTARKLYIMTRSDIIGDGEVVSVKWWKSSVASSSGVMM
jgi:pimeloyl-ACP methyl ester carboxylesterase